MRTFLVIALTIVAMTAARAEERPVPLVDRPAPEVFLSGGEGWQLSGVAGYDLQNNVVVLTIEGDVFNAGKAERKAPIIRLAVRDQAKREIYNWTVRAKDDRVRPGEWTTYSARLESPPPDVYSVEIKAVAQD